MDGDDKDKEIARLRAELDKRERDFIWLNARLSEVFQQLKAWEEGRIRRIGKHVVVCHYHNLPDAYRELGF